MTVVRCLLSVLLTLSICGCASIGDKYRKLHNRVIGIYADPALLTRADYEAAAKARLRNRGQTSFGLDVRPSRSPQGAYIDFELAILWTPQDAFTSSYFDFSKAVRANVERRLGPPLVSSGDSAYWVLPTGILIVDVDPLHAMIFYPARYAELPDLVEVPDRLRIPSPDISASRIASLTMSRSGFERYSYAGVMSSVDFWNRETRELVSVRRRASDPRTIYISYLAPRAALDIAETGFMTHVLAHLGLAAHRETTAAALARAAAGDYLEYLSIDNIVYEIEGKPSGIGDGRLISVTACERRSARYRQAEYGSPCSQW